MATFTILLALVVFGVALVAQIKALATLGKTIFASRNLGDVACGLLATCTYHAVAGVVFEVAKMLVN